MKLNFPVPDQTLRELTWDGLQHGIVPTVLDVLGLPGESPDVRDMEHTASHERCSELLPFVVPIGILSKTMGGIHAGATIAAATEAGMPVSEDLGLEMAEAYSRVIVSGVVAILSQLMSTGQLVVPKKMGYK